MQTNCGSCDWHTALNLKRETYCEDKQAWVSIDGTCDDFKTYESGKGDPERRAAARSKATAALSKHIDAQTKRATELAENTLVAQRRSNRWIIAGVIIAVITLLFFILRG